jgi:hypothetical protein
VLKRGEKLQFAVVAPTDKENNNSPIVYIMAEESYKPNGWLGLQLGKTVWIGCWTTELVDSNLTQLLQRAKPSGASALPPVKVPPSTVASKPATSSPDVLGLLTAMKTQLDNMTASLEQLKTDQAAIKSGQASLQSAVSNVEISLASVKVDVTQLRLDTR